MPLGFVAEAEPSLQPPASALERAIGSKGQVGITDILLRRSSNFDLTPVRHRQTDSPPLRTVGLKRRPHDDVQ